MELTLGRRVDVVSLHPAGSFLTHSSRLTVDPATLADLEVFRSTAGGPGVFHLLDRTATAAGSGALRRRLEAPPAGADAIRASQEEVAFFMRNPRLLRLDDRSMRRVAAYLDCAIWVRSRTRVGRALEQGWMRLRYGDLIQELRDGVGVTLQFFRRMQRLCAEALALDPPEPLQAALARLGATADAVLASRVPGRLLVTVDRRLRMELRDPIAEALAFVAELDALDAMATTSRERGWVLPEVIDGEGFLVEAEGLVHPFVGSAVPNPVALDRDGPLIFLTGPNMAGKTTWIRAVGVAVLLAQAGMGVPARRMRIAPAEALFTSLHPIDDLQEGRSTFMAEVLRVRAAAELLAEEGRALVLFDEVFRGTNVLDARDASLSVIRGFSRTRRGAAVFSSHLADLAEGLREEPGIRFCRFGGRVVEGEPRFDYTLRDGVSDQRFGMLLLRRAGIPELLTRIAGRPPA